MLRQCEGYLLDQICRTVYRSESDCNLLYQIAVATVALVFSGITKLYEPMCLAMWRLMPPKIRTVPSWTLLQPRWAIMRRSLVVLAAEMNSTIVV
jgi:hypothetical protein